MHSIRLRGPWQYQILEKFDDDLAKLPQVASEKQPSGELRFPCDWAAPLTRLSRLELRRSFNAPTGIGSSLVAIVVDGLNPAENLNLTMALNHCSIPPTTSGWSVRFDITTQIQPHNQLVFHITLNPRRTYPGEVTLQISDV